MPHEQIGGFIMHQMQAVDNHALCCGLSRLPEIFRGCAKVAEIIIFEGFTQSVNQSTT